MGIGHNHAAWVNELVVMVIEKIEAGYFTRVDTSTVCIQQCPGLPDLTPNYAKLLSMLAAEFACGLKLMQDVNFLQYKILVGENFDEFGKSMSIRRNNFVQFQPTNRESAQEHSPKYYLKNSTSTVNNKQCVLQ